MPLDLENGQPKPQKDATNTPQTDAAHQAGARTDDSHQTALRQSELRYRRLFEAAQDGILMLDAATRKITDANPFMTELLGYPHSELLGKELWEIGLLKDEEASRAAFEKLQEATFIRYENLPLQTKNGYRRDVEFVSNVYEEGDRSVIQCNIRDISDRKQVELEERTTKLREAITDLEHFSYSMGHDMRAPLRCITAFSGFLAEEYQDKFDAQAADYLRRIVSASQRMDELIRDVLTYSQVARQPLTIAPVDLDQLIRDILGEIPGLSSTQAQVDLVGPLAKVTGSRVLVGQCLSHLLDNARKFVQPGVKPQLRVWTEDRAGRVRVCVQDTGLGIPTSQFTRLWRIFERGQHDIEYGGTGIGLSIVKRAVERMGGTVGLRSELGKGSTFWFELARAE